jgi:hypothetical protein
MLYTLSFHRRLHILKALAVLSKYLGLYNDFKLLMKQYGLKWSNNDKDDIIIARMLKPLRSSSVIEWIRKVDSSVPKLKTFIDFMIYSGLRPLESIDSYNLMIKLNSNIHEYYDRKQQMLQHFKYRSIFIRRTKKCYISFIPYEMIQKVIKSNTVIRKRLYRHLERKNLPARFCDIREYWATYMPKYLTRPEIDFLQGRVSGSVFMINYFNPSYITDLKTRTIKASKKLLRKIRCSISSNTPLFFYYRIHKHSRGS